MRALAATAIVLVLIPAATLAGTLRVPTDHAFIQSAILAAADGDTVVVAPGEYELSASIDFQGKAIELTSEAGAAMTVLRRENEYENGAVVRFASGESASSVLAGFTITGGTGEGDESPLGGGVYCLDSSPTLRDLVIVENRAYYGGGLYCENASPRVERCSLSHNSVNCGGGAYLHASSPTFFDCRIVGNRGQYASSGVHNKSGSAPVLLRCWIVGNQTYMGGGIDAFGSAPTLINCVLAANRAASGGAVHCADGAVTIQSCTIAGNRADDGGDFWLSSGDVSVAGSILWDNAPRSTSWSGYETAYGADPRFVAPGVFDQSRYRTVTIAGEEHELPDFVLEPPDFHLLPDSPALDAVPGASAPELDIDGTPRPCGAAADRGAYETCYSEQRFLRGDASGDGSRDLADAVSVLEYLFAGASAPGCPDAADADDSGRLDIADPVFLLGWLFAGLAAPPEPASTCGSDPTTDLLVCPVPGACE